jgi:hypothetical protein
VVDQFGVDVSRAGLLGGGIPHGEVERGNGHQSAQLAGGEVQVSFGLRRSLGPVKRHVREVAGLTRLGGPTDDPSGAL